MTWTKTGDEFADECWTLSDAAYRLHHEGLTWSNRKQTDGQLAKDDMRRWARRPEAAEELVNIGWWEDGGQHYQIVHHLGYQRTKDETAHQSNVNRENANKRWKAAQARKAAKAEKAAKAKAASESLSEPQCDSQCEVARTGQDRPLLGNSTENGELDGISPADLDLCHDCREKPPVGPMARPSDDPFRCRRCNDEQQEDYLAALEREQA